MLPSVGERVRIRSKRTQELVVEGIVGVVISRVHMFIFHNNPEKIGARPASIYPQPESMGCKYSWVITPDRTAYYIEPSIKRIPSQKEVKCPQKL